MSKCAKKHKDRTLINLLQIEIMGIYMYENDK